MNLSSIFKKNENPSIHFNTGTMFDLLTGRLQQGYDGKWYINGGISNLMYLFQGRTHSYKSTTIDSLIANTLSIYKDMEAVILDTENHKLDSKRYDDLAPNGIEVSDRVLLSEKLYISEVLDKIIELDDMRTKYKKELTILTPFLNYKNERITSFITLPLFIDSLSALDSKAEKDVLRKNDLEDSKMNMIFMNDGRRKTILTKAIKSVCMDSGIAFFGTAHVGEVTNLANPMAPPKKEMMYMKQGEKIKGTPKSTTYGAQILIETSATTAIDSKTKEANYPMDNEQVTNLNELNLFLQKGKNQVSGVNFKVMVTQKHGWDNALTCFDYLKKDKTDGLLYSGTGHGYSAPCLMPDKKSSKNTIRKNLEESYELRRAMDILAQMKFVREFYDRNDVPLDIDSIDLNKAAEKLLATDSTLVTDIVNSRGYWTYAEDPRPYMSVYDVFELLNKHM